MVAWITRHCFVWWIISCRMERISCACWVQPLKLRHLENEPNHPTLALCYEFQMLPKLETEEHDIPVDYVLWA